MGGQGGVGAVRGARGEAQRPLGDPARAQVRARDRDGRVGGGLPEAVQTAGASGDESAADEGD